MAAVALSICTYRYICSNCNVFECAIALYDEIKSVYVCKCAVNIVLFEHYMVRIAVCNVS